MTCGEAVTQAPPLPSIANKGEITSSSTFRTAIDGAKSYTDVIETVKVAVEADPKTGEVRCSAEIPYLTPADPVAAIVVVQPRLAARVTARGSACGFGV